VILQIVQVGLNRVPLKSAARRADPLGMTAIARNPPAAELWLMLARYAAEARYERLPPDRRPVVMLHPPERERSKKPGRQHGLEAEHADGPHHGASDSVLGGVSGDGAG
jgi:hypothetical protein